MATFCTQCGTANELAPGTRGTCPKCGSAVTAAGAAPGFAPAAPRLRTSKMAVASLVFGLLFCLPLVSTLLAIGFGIAALVAISNRPSELKGQGLAIAGIALSVVMVFFGGIMAAIAIPNFIKFQSRSKQSEARANLRALYTGGKMYEAENNKPATGFADFGFSPEPHRRYAYFAGDEALQPDLGGPYKIPADLLTAARAPGVVAVAVGNIDSDATLDVWIVDEGGVPKALRDDAQE